MSTLPTLEPSFSPAFCTKEIKICQDVLKTWRAWRRHQILDEALQNLPHESEALKRLELLKLAAAKHARQVIDLHISE